MFNCTEVVLGSRVLECIQDLDYMPRCVVIIETATFCTRLPVLAPYVARPSGLYPAPRLRAAPVASRRERGEHLSVATGYRRPGL